MRRKNHNKQLDLSKIKIKQGKSSNNIEEYSIYDNQQSSSEIQSIPQQEQSSFELEQDQNKSTQQQRKNIQKLLDRLGLNAVHGGVNKNQDLQLVVNNFVENCIETVDQVANIEEYQNLYDSQYQQKLKNYERNESAIYFSQLTQLQSTLKIQNKGIKSIYRRILLIIRYISMTCQKIIIHPIFQGFILIIIMLNSLKMATDDPLSSTTTLHWAENSFTVIYVIEMSLKIMAYGFLFNKGAYLRDIWNIMDFSIVLTSLLPLFINLSFSVNALRAFRVLRPLRTITKIKALKQIMKTLFYSFSLVMDSIYILLFVIFVFAIAGMQLFGGEMKHRCMELSTGALTSILCSANSDCISSQICAKGISSPNFSIQNFDTILWSALNVFQSITLQGWSAIMRDIQIISGAVYFIYSILIVFICEYVLLNMTLAILKYKYSQVKDNLIEEEEQDREEYQPDLLRKIGIFDKISKLSHPQFLVRTNNPSKSQVGCFRTLPIQQLGPTVKISKLLAYLQQAKISEKSIINQKQELNLTELRQLGKISDLKWDVQQLEFQNNILNQKQDYIVRALDKPASDKTIEGKEDSQQFVDQSFDSMQQMLESEDEDSQQNQKEQKLAEFAIEAQQKLRQNYMVSEKMINGFKISKKNQQPEEQIKRKARRQISDLDNLLALIGGKPGTQQPFDLEADIPEVNFKDIVAQKIFERFADLGQFSLKRANKANQLKMLDINAAQKKQQKKQNKKKQLPIQAANEETALDLKQLQLRNQLQRKEMRCRIKHDDILDKTRKYDIMRVSISLRMRQIQQKRLEIRQNMSALNFHVKYQKNNEKKETQKSTIFARNLENQKMILKIPQQSSTSQGQVAISRQDTQTSISGKSQGNSKYLKLLQNYQMQDRIQFNYDKIMSVYFKPQINKKKQEETHKLSSQEQYQLILEEDILKKHGHLELQFPVSLQTQPEILSFLNMKKQQYEINIRGIQGLFRVIRKKTLLFVSSLFYDNFILIIVFANTLLMSLSGFVNTDDEPYHSINYFFTIVFVIDLSIKVFAYGISFFSDIMNLFDAGVVAISLVQLSMGGSNLSALRSIRILRAFRVLRITRLIRSLEYMKIIMNVIVSVVNQFIYVFLLLFLFIFIFTLLGMQIFGGSFVPQSVSGIRQNYDTFFNAFFTIFQVLTVQNWNDILTATALSSAGPWSILFLISWIFLGNWMLLSLLQAILLDGFDDDSTNPQQESSKTQVQTVTNQPSPTDIQDSTENLIQDEQIQEGTQNSSKKDLKLDIDDASLFLFKPNHPVRRFSLFMIKSTVFEAVMFIIILLSSAKLALDTYIDGEQGAIHNFATYFDLSLNFIFIAQCLLKVISYGLIVGQESYLSNSWNRLDFFIVCISIIDMMLSGVNLSIIKLLRTLRPLRIITRNQQMKIMVTSLMQSVIGIINLLIIVLCVYLMFAILGMNLLQGKLSYCNLQGNNLVTGLYGPYGIDSKSCETQGGAWTTQLINFENVANSMLSLYVFSTRQNWPFYVFTFIDSSQSGPVKDNNQIVYFIYAVIFIFICSLFLMDLLVGVLFTNYHETESKINPKTLSDKQINWKNLQKLIIQQDPCFQLYIAPKNGIRKVLFDILSTKAFQIAIAVVIIFNIFVMGLSNDDISSQYSNLLDTLNSVCSYIFIAELGLKLFTYRRAYFLSMWNIFDFFVVSASILDIILHYLGVGGGSKNVTLSLLPQIARIFRVLRITRLLRMLKRFKGLQKLIQTFLFSLPAIAKAFSILLLYLFISSILASNLMGGLYGDYSSTFSQILNYKDFHHSIQTLFVNLSGQNWYYFMFFSTSQGYAQCDISTSSSCISPFYFIFWLPFIFFGQKVFLQLFVLVVLDQFEQNYINEHNPLGIFSLYEQDFRQKWIQQTKKYHSQKIQTKNLINLMLHLKSPLGLSREQTLQKYKEELLSNQNSTNNQIEQKMNELDQKLKKNAAILLNKMNLIKKRIYFGYHQTFYHFVKLATVPQFTTQATSQQIKLMNDIHKSSQQALQKLKPTGNLYYYGQLQGSQENIQPLNPISLILFTQMIVKGWHNYSLRNKKNNNQKDNDYNLFDSLNDSCASDLNQAQFQKIAPEKRVAIRRGGLIENKLVHKCEFQPPNQICGAYEDGKKTKFKNSFRSSKISGSKKSKISKSSKHKSKQIRFTLRSNAEQQ